MTPPVVNPLDVAFVFAVTFAGLVYPPAALAVGAGFFALSWYMSDKRSEGPPT